MHENWKDDEDGGRQAAYASLKKDCERMMADVTEQVLSEDMESVFSTMDSMSDLMKVMVKEDTDPHEIVKHLPPSYLRSMAVWAAVGIRSTFVRALDAAILNDTLEQE